LRLDPRDLRGAAARVRAEFGPSARIAAAEEIRVGGIAGFFARRMYELTIDYDEAVPQAEAVPRAEDLRTGSRMSGISALLEEADRAEGLFPGAVGSSALPVSTQSDQFSLLLGSLTASVGAPVISEEPPAPPLFSPTPGGMLAIVGLRDDALRVAISVAAGMPQAEVAIAGDIPSPHPRVEDRRTATSARATAVERGGIVIVAVGLGAGGPLAEANASRVPLIAADAVWVAVDATRKPEDTGRWVAAVRAVASVREMAVLDADRTETPESVRDLGLRPAWPKDAG
jgi:hypothetical protein